MGIPIEMKKICLVFKQLLFWVNKSIIPGGFAMKFFLQLLFLSVFLFPVNLALAQIKNECIAREEDHLLMMERMPNHRFFCVDARFLNDCRGPDNGKVTLVYAYEETDSLRSEFATSISITSKTDGQIKIGPGRVVTAVKKGQQYQLFVSTKGYTQRTYIESAEAIVNGKKVKALRGGSVRKNTYLLDVSEKVARVLIDLKDPCQREPEEESYEDSTKGKKTAKQELSLPCELENIERAFSNLSQGDYEAALQGFDYKYKIAYVVLLDRKTEGVSLVELTFDESCMPIETSLKDYINVKKFFNKLDGPTVNKNLQGMERGHQLILRGMKK